MLSLHRLGIKFPGLALYTAPPMGITLGLPAITNNKPPCYTPISIIIQVLIDRSSFITANYLNV